MSNQENIQKSGFLAVQTPSDQIEKNQLLDQLQQNEQIKYIGLQNKGATCYMNSILQTLFMTPDFRKNLYKQNLNEEEFDAENSIVFQLQKLFAKMQTNFSSYVDTQELIKSFQWDQQQAFEQHDVQEFIRILFDAIESSIQGSKDQDFLKNMYQGRSQYYIKCTECNNESVKEELYNDIIITIKNIFDKIYNESLEKGFQRYLKPEILENDNAYYCSKCEKKVKAIKGCKFVEFPEILTVVLNRFTFDFFTMQRIKLNDFVNFPFILNLNDYINGYDGIKNKLKEENVDPKYFDNSVIIKPTNEDIQNQKNQNKIKSNKSYTSTTKSSIYKKTNVKARTQGTSDFIKNMRRQNQGKKLQDDVILVDSKQTINENQSLLNNTTQQSVTEESTIPTNRSQQISDLDNSQQNLLEKKQNESVNINKSQNEEILLEKQEINTENSTIVQEETISKLGETTQQDQNLESQNQNINENKQQEKLEKEKDIKQLKEQFEKDLINALNSQEEENQNKIKEYKQQGDLVYELYSLLIHSGGAYGGHYYVIIKSFEDNKWYNYNDTRVSQFDIRELKNEAFGGNPRNAYMLFYRKVGDSSNQNNISQQLSDDLIPEKIKEILKKEKKIMEEQQELDKYKSELITIRVCYQVDVKLITLSKKSSLENLKQKAIQEFKFTNLNPSNIRVRNYKAQTDTMLETYTGRENKSLEELNIGNYKNICLEVKTDEQKFEEYDFQSLNIKLCLWNNSIESLDENNLKVEKIKTKADQQFGEFFNFISQYTKIHPQELKILQKHLNCFEVISLENNKDKGTYHWDHKRNIRLRSRGGGGQRINKSTQYKMTIFNIDTRLQAEIQAIYYVNITNLVSK